MSPRAQLSVTRGGQVDLRHAILFTDQAATADCQVQFIARDHCGRVEPTRFGCSSYSGPIHLCARLQSMIVTNSAFLLATVATPIDSV